MTSKVIWTRFVKKIEIEIFVDINAKKKTIFHKN